MPRLTFLLHELTVSGGVTRALSLLANALSESHDVALVGLYKQNKPFPYPLAPGIKLGTLYTRPLSFEDLKDYTWMLSQGKVLPVLADARQFMHMARFFPRAQKRLARILRDTDILIVSQYYGWLFVPDTFRGKVVGQIMTCFDEFYSSTLNRFILKRYYPRMDRLVVLTRNDRDRYTALGYTRTRNIYNPLPFICEDTTASGTSPGENRNIVYLGRLTKQKGLDRLARSFQLLKSQGAKNTRLLLYGGGYLESELRDFFKREGIEDQVDFCGITHDVKQVLLTRARVLALPSRYEGFGMVLAEALECGVPVVTYRSFAGVDEIVQDGYNGFVIEQDDERGFAEKLLLLLNDDQLWKSMSNNAYESTRKFRIEDILQHWKQLLKEIGND